MNIPQHQKCPFLPHFLSVMCAVCRPVCRCALLPPLTPGSYVLLTPFFHIFPLRYHFLLFTSPVFVCVDVHMPQSACESQKTTMGVISLLPPHGFWQKDCRAFKTCLGFRVRPCIRQPKLKQTHFMEHKHYQQVWEPNKGDIFP